MTDQFFPCDRFIATAWEPTSFIFTDDRYKTTVKPYFTDDAKVEYEKTEDGLTIRFTQAQIDEDMIDDYIIRLRNKKDGTVAKQAAVWSHYYLYCMPETCEVTFKDVCAGEYTVEIFAQGFWKNRSEKPLAAEITVD